MAKSRHHNWMYKVDGKQRIYRVLTNDYDVLEYRQYPYTPESVEALIQTIQDNLTSNLIPPNITATYQATHERWNYPFFGYCVPATFALLYFIDTKKLRPMMGTDNEGGKHWWLEEKNGRVRYDATAAQFSTEEALQAVYATGKESGFYGGYKPNYEMPYASFFDLMHKVQPDAIRWKARELKEPTPGTLDRFFS